jgi:hypothetical protein
MLDLIGGNGQVLSISYPGFGDASQSLVVKTLHQAGQAAALLLDHLQYLRSQRVGTSAGYAAYSFIFQIV